MIIPTRQGLAIMNPTFGLFAQELGLPHMSRDLYFWLQARFSINSAPENIRDNLLDDFLHKDMSPASQRAHYAAARCYLAKIADDNRELTAYGWELAERTKEVQRQGVRRMKDNPASTPMLPYNLDIEEMIITGEISWRAIGLLKLIDAGIKQAIINFINKSDRSELPPAPIDHSQAVVNLTTEDQLAEISQIAKKIQEQSEQMKKEDGTEPIAKLDKSNQFNQITTGVMKSALLSKEERKEYSASDVNPVTIRTVQNDIVAFVPVAPLYKSIGKTDIKELARYSLIDVRSVRTGTRGRARLGMLVSDLGQKFIAELHNRNLSPLTISGTM